MKIFTTISIKCHVEKIEITIFNYYLLLSFELFQSTYIYLSTDRLDQTNTNVHSL